MRRAIVLFAACALFLSYALALPASTQEFFAADFADVLSPETESFIITQSAELERQTGAQIVVATVKTLDGIALEDYSLRLAREWKIGDEKKNNGVLILLSLGERKLRVEVGYGLEGALPDSKTGRLMDDYAIGFLKEDKFDEGLKNLYSAVLSEVYGEYGLSVPDEVTPIPAEEEGGNVYVGAILVIAILAFVIFTNAGRGGRRGGHYGGFGGGGFSGGGGGGGFSGGGGSFGGGGGSRGF